MEEMMKALSDLVSEMNDNQAKFDALTTSMVRNIQTKEQAQQMAGIVSELPQAAGLRPMLRVMMDTFPHQEG